MRKPIAVLAVAASAAALACPAVAAERTAQFRVTAEGVQTNTWSSSYRSQGRCDTSGEAHGTETVRFASRKAARATVGDDPYLHFGKGFQPLPLSVQAKVTRHGVQHTDPTPPECGGTDGQDGQSPPPPKPDCGTKRVPWQLRAQYWIGSSAISLMHSGGLFSDPFKSCVTGGVSFPDILSSNTKGDMIRGTVKEARLFDSRVDTIVVHAAGRKVEKKPGLGIDRTATVDWKITFHRIEKDK